MGVTQPVAKEYSAGLAPYTFISTNESGLPDKGGRKKGKLLLQVNASPSIIDTIEKHDDQISDLLARLDDLEQEWFLYKNLAEKS
jgi:hypothetical protein